jgi:hypothetical protein
MEYKDIVQHLRNRDKIRLARFIEMYYIENKSQEDIMQELYIESVWGYYSMKRRIRTIICTIIEDNKKK